MNDAENAVTLEQAIEWVLDNAHRDPEAGKILADAARMIGTDVSLRRAIWSALQAYAATVRVSPE